MNEIAVYLKNLDYFVIVDILVAIALIGLCSAFFLSKRSIKVYFLLLALILCYALASVINAFTDNAALLLTATVFRYLLLFSLVGIAVVYQSDLKNFAQKIAARKGKSLFTEGFGSNDELEEATAEIITAAQNMAKQDIGALIILTPTTVDSHILESGTTLDAKLSAPLLESIFFTKTPLHDGAVVVKGNRIIAAGCFLPLTQDVSLPQELGTRHRAAIGITEESDVLAIVVSEETGIISIAKKGKLIRYMTIEKLKDEIRRIYGISPLQTNER